MGLRKGIAVFAGAAAVAAGVVLAMPGSDADASGKELSHKQATAKLRNANITWVSSGNCGDRNNPTCTSFSKIKSGTINGIITFKKSSHCKVTITGGTETGHASGTYSHWNGYKVDISPTSCVTRYIKNNFSYLGGNQWKSGSGNIYFNEGDHWDITVY